MTQSSRLSEETLRPYLPRLLLEWMATSGEAQHLELDGSLVFIDLSGFTNLSERLAKLGKMGAEELSDAINMSFAHVLAAAHADGGGLLKFGGDALLVLFSGEQHPLRACHAAIGMRQALREVGQLSTAGGRVALRMSAGVHSGPLQFFLVGESHRELIVAGPGATRTALMEAAAATGEIVISDECAAHLPPKLVGEPRGPGKVLRGRPQNLPALDIRPDVRLAAEDMLGCIPTAVREHLMTGSAHPEHRPVTIAFLRYEGTDDLVRDEGAATAAEKIGAVVKAVQRAVDAQNITFLGTDVDKNGGKIILAAGAPRVIGHDDERMLLAVHEIASADLPLSLRIGVNRGHVFAGDIGPSYRRTYTIMGDAVNVAARLMAACAPGAVTAAEGVIHRARVAFETNPLEPLELKGKSRPVAAHEVLRPRRAASVESDRLPLVGRETEVEALLAKLERARAQRGQVAEVVAEAGMGKSRLIQELIDRAATLTVTIRCDLYTSSTPYGALRDPLRRLLGADADDDVATATAKIESFVRNGVPDALPWLPLLNIPLDVAFAETTETSQLADRFRRPRLEQLVRDLLSDILPRPSILVVEDAHWLDEASAGLMSYLCEESADRPWLLCITRRDQTDAFTAPSGVHVETLRLDPLAIEDASELLDLAAPDRPMTAHNAALLAERAGGNPLFLKELLSVAETSDLEELPDSIEGLMVARIDALAPRDCAFLRRLSVLGPSFSEDLVLVVTESQAVEPDTWNRLEEFVVKDDGSFRFRHALMRDAAYGGLAFKLRRRLHAGIATHIESTAARAEEFAEELSLHFFLGARYDAAWSYSRMAGDKARSIYANADAARFYARAFDAGRHAGVDRGELASVLSALGDVRDLAGELARASEAYDAARRLVDGNIETAQLFRKQAWTRQRSGKYRAAATWLGRGLRTLEGVKGPEASGERARLCVAYGVVRFHQGKHREAVKWAQRAIPEAEKGSDLGALAHAYRLLDPAYSHLGRHDLAVHSPTALRIYEQIGDVANQAEVLNNMGVKAHLQGKWPEAREFYERGLEAHQRSGNVVGAAIATGNIGEMLADQGRLEEAERYLRDADKVWRACGYMNGVASAMAQVGRVLCRRGWFEEGIGLLEQASALADQLNAENQVQEARARIAEAWLLRGDAERALALAGALAISSAAELPPQAPLLYRVQAWALLLLGDDAAADAAAKRSLELATARESDLDRALALRAAAAAARARAEPVEEFETQSREILDRLEVVNVPEPAVETPVPGPPNVPG